MNILSNRKLLHGFGSSPNVLQNSVFFVASLATTIIRNVFRLCVTALIRSYVYSVYACRENIAHSTIFRISQIRSIDRHTISFVLQVKKIIRFTSEMEGGFYFYLFPEAIWRKVSSCSSILKSLYFCQGIIHQYRDRIIISNALSKISRIIESTSSTHSVCNSVIVWSKLYNIGFQHLESIVLKCLAIVLRKYRTKIPYTYTFSLKGGNFVLNVGSSFARRHSKAWSSVYKNH